MSAASRRYIEQALKELDNIEPSHALAHVEMYLRDALIWLRDEPKPTARPPHPNTMIGRK